MADPNQMFSVPQQVEGPLAGYMRGIMGDYGMQQQDQLAQQRSIQNTIDQMKADEMQKNIPLQDAARGNAMSANQDQAGAWASGQQGQLNNATRNAALEEKLSAIDTSKLHKMDNEMTWATAASQAMSSAEGPAAKADIWKQFKTAGEAIGIKGLSDNWDDVAPRVMGSAKAGVMTRPVIAKILEQGMTNASHEKIATINAEGHVKAAAAAYGANMDKLLAGMPADKRIEFELNKKLEEGTLFTPKDIERARQVEYDAREKDPKVNSQRASAEKDFTLASEKEKAVKNKEMGLPASNTDTRKYANAVVEQEINSEVDKAITRRYGAGRILVGDEVKKVGDYIKNPNESPKASPAATVVKAAGAVPDLKAKPMPSSSKDAVKGEVYQTSKGPALWDGTKLIPVPKDRVPASAAPPMPPQGSGPVTQANQLWQDRPPDPSTMNLPAGPQDMGVPTIAPPMMNPNG